jgi:hypothetical protein
MNDDQMDQLLRDGVRDYNEPGAVPRDEMWTRIQEARASRSNRSDRSPFVAHRSPRWVWPTVGVAAAVLLAVGVMIGRRMEHVDATTPVVQTAAAKPAIPATGAAVKAAVPDSTDKLIGQLREQTKATNRRVQELASGTPSPRRSSDSRANVSQSPGLVDERSANGAPSLAYRLVVLQHLAGTEAMITSFRSSAKRGETDAQIAAWSRELLSTTRMLAASPVTKDPVMKRLLEDLDLVITQIVQYTSRGTNNPDELDLIEQSINKRGVIMKLRGTIPARASLAGT